MALRKCSVGIALAFLATTLAGCAAFDPYEGVPYGSYKFGNSPFTLADLRAQDAAEKGCYRWADETNPSDARMMRAFFANGFASGGIGGGAGTAAAEVIVGVSLTATSVAAGAASYALAAGFVNAGSGHIYRTVLVHEDIRYCKMAAAYGFHFFAPSDVEKLRRGEIKEIPVAELPDSVLKEAQAVIGALVPHPPAP
jgi:hypothetical protein